MDDHENMRASDADRQETVERLRTALDDGRLKLEEYLERMGHAYEAVTYGDLGPLTADLPKTRSVAKPSQPAPPAPAHAAPAPARPAEVERSGWFAGLPKPLKVAWTAWTIAVSVNVVVWVLVCITATSLIYPWPLWVAGPWGAVLLAISATTSSSRRGRQPPPRPLPPGQG
jgi:hypothetical protein